MATKNVNKKDQDLIDDVIVLRSVYGKVGQKYFMQPCIDPQTGEFPPCVKKITANGDMILTDAERNSGFPFIRVNEVFTITDGQVFDMKKPREKAIWEAIKNNPMIAPERWAKDSNGNYLIDGTMGYKNLKPRYGTAELYVDRPGLEAQQRVSKKNRIRQALNFIYDDERGYDGRVLKARLLGRDMTSYPDADITDYLVQKAEKDPEVIITLYTGDDLSLRILFMEAKDKKVIYSKNKLYIYGDNITLGATDDAVLNWMKQPSNNKILELIRKDTYPDLYKE